MSLVDQFDQLRRLGSAELSSTAPCETVASEGPISVPGYPGVAFGFRLYAGDNGRSLTVAVHASFPPFPSPRRGGVNAEIVQVRVIRDGTQLAHTWVAVDNPGGVAVFATVPVDADAYEIEVGVGSPSAGMPRQCWRYQWRGSRAGT